MREVYAKISKWKRLQSKRGGLQTPPPNEKRTQVAPSEANTSDSKSTKHQEEITFARVDAIYMVKNRPSAKSVIPRFS